MNLQVVKGIKAQVENKMIAPRIVLDLININFKRRIVCVYYI